MAMLKVCAPNTGVAIGQPLAKVGRSEMLGANLCHTSEPWCPECTSGRIEPVGLESSDGGPVEAVYRCLGCRALFLYLRGAGGRLLNGRAIVRS